MDGSHPSDFPVPNEHIVRVDWWRTTLDATAALGKGFEGQLFIPYDVKKQSAKYELPDGTKFDNPDGDLHHRSERRDGLGDIELSVHYRLNRWRFTGGVAVPTGEIEHNPYELGGMGLPHRHIQFGTGT